MSELNAYKKQEIVDLLKDAAPAAPPPASPGALPGPVFNIHPGANVGPITTTTIHLYAESKRDTHGN